LWHFKSSPLYFFYIKYYLWLVEFWWLNTHIFGFWRLGFWWLWCIRSLPFKSSLAMRYGVGSCILFASFACLTHLVSPLWHGKGLTPTCDTWVCSLSWTYMGKRLQAHIDFWTMGPTALGIAEGRLTQNCSLRLLYLDGTPSQCMCYLIHQACSIDVEPLYWAMCEQNSNLSHFASMHLEIHCLQSASEASHVGVLYSKQYNIIFLGCSSPLLTNFLKSKGSIAYLLDIVERLKTQLNSS